MRTPKALSPSALARWEDRREEFYERYISEVRTPKAPQVNYMAAGSGFDAFVKSAIYDAVFGSSKGTKFDRNHLFETQVEEHIRTEVWERCEFLFEQYQKVGSFAHLLNDIMRSPYAPEMEFKVSANIQGVPIMGYPDLRYVTKEMVHVIADFKVNGSFSKHGVSPVQGYQMARSWKKGAVKEEIHKKYRERQFKDVVLSENCLGDFERDWATQLTMYAWCLGEEPGSEDYVVRMEQLACRPNKDGDINVKVATHMSQISQRFQMEVIRRLVECWDFVQKGHIFTELTLEESQKQCELIDQRLKLPPQTGNPVIDKYMQQECLRFK